MTGLLSLPRLTLAVTPTPRRHPGSRKPSAEGDAAARRAARTEGIFLDPVFGAKAMAALLDAARVGRLAGPVIFLVSGRAPTLFTAGSL
jgi:D-cysteine desulfhydrase